ncbi:MAG TPA: DUF4394 domain-containing protein [Pyrinomonadaceae bacterium]|nr:DUF4394 domain-containing protein [Pyrinomonadaceae bacterium]
MKLIFAALSQALTRPALYALVVIAFAANIAQANYNGIPRGDANRTGVCGDRRSGHDSGNQSDNLEVVGLTSDQRLICFDEKRPEDSTTIGRIFGLVTDSNLVGIDFRPANGVLYALGNAGGIYTLSLDTAEATLRSRLNVALAGSFFGVDFNPTVDRLRIISDLGQNLRANVENGATTPDDPINYTSGTPTIGVTAVAYTNNDSDPNTATTLFDIDSTLDQVAIQAPPNAGTLNPTGKLNVNTTADVGFDIYSFVRNGSTVDVRGLATLVTGGQAGLYQISLFTGKATLSGKFSSQDVVIDIAIPLVQQ